MTNFDLEKREILPQEGCVNCGQSFNGFFCPKCGQRSLEGRFTIKESAGWIFDKIFNLERGMFFTIKELFINPRETIDNYLKRATVRYMHPFRFVFLLSTVSALVTILSGAFESAAMMQGLEGYVEGFNRHDAMNAESVASIEKGLVVMESIKKYLAFIMLANIPVNALASYLVYYKRRYNYTEHLILNCYVYGFSLVVGLPLFLIVLFEGGGMIYSGVNTLIILIAYAYIFSKFFKENIIKSFLKIIAQFILVMIIMIFLVITGLFIYGLFKAKLG
ncbi:MAG: DUF3667 domain-containing protein [Flavobacteriales bacterium]|nr:DUF3667 domain-containing protein [Flavobacteriales bacterium]